MGTNEVSIGFWAAFSFLLVSIVLAGIVNLNFIARQMAEMEQRNTDATESMRELRQYSQFNNKTINDQDIVATILEYRGAPFVRVKDATGVTSTWSAYDISEMGIVATSQTYFQLSYINTDYFDKIIDSNGDRRGWYFSTLIYDAGGSIVGIDCVFKSRTDS